MRRTETEPAGNLRDLDMYDFMERASPGMVAPHYFSRIVDAFEGATTKGLRCVISAPRQHGKTSVCKHAIARTHLKWPRTHIIYATYAQEYTESQSRDIRRIEIAAGVKISEDHNTIKGWGVEGQSQRGKMIATSVDGRANGEKGNVVIVDDPYKSPEEAYSAQRREQVWDWFRYVIRPTMAPGASVYIVASRWDDDDLSGRCIADLGYDEIRIEAINETDPTRPIGAALCPDGPDPAEPRDLKFLLELKKDIGEHAFSAQMQGKPLPRSGSLFESPTYYKQLPDGARVECIGVDLAVSTGAKSDFAAVVALARLGNMYFIPYAHRIQKRVVEVEAMFKATRNMFPGARMASYMAGTERGLFDLMYHRGVEIERLPARYSKGFRAQRTSIAWNEGRIQLPMGAPWLKWFVPEVTHFTGENDTHDDGVDAMVSAFDVLESSAPVGWAGGGFTFGKPCM